MGLVSRAPSPVMCWPSTNKHPCFSAYICLGQASLSEALSVPGQVLQGYVEQHIHYLRLYSSLRKKRRNTFCPNVIPD